MITFSFMCRWQLSDSFFVPVCPCLFFSAPLSVSVCLCLQPFSSPMSPPDGFFCSCVSPSVPLILPSTSLVLSTLITPAPLFLILYLCVHLHLTSTSLTFHLLLLWILFSPQLPFRLLLSTYFFFVTHSLFFFSSVLLCDLTLSP